VILAMTIPGLAILIVAVACADVAYRRVTGHTALPWMRIEGDRAAAAIGFEQFDAIFGSGKRVELEQRQAVLMHRASPGDGAPGGIEVDLSAGRATLRQAQ
jgi:hypothetical protein